MTMQSKRIGFGIGGSKKPKRSRRLSNLTAISCYYGTTPHFRADRTGARRHPFCAGRYPVPSGRRAAAPGRCRAAAAAPRWRPEGGATCRRRSAATGGDQSGDRRRPAAGFPRRPAQSGDELLRRALTRLSPEHRQVIDLVYYHEKSVDEVAQILDVTS
jgi:hypothetical protein